MGVVAAPLARLAGLVLLCTACYTYAPSGTTPVSGSEVAIVLTDKGRVALNERVGPEMDQLRGRLLSNTDTSVAISMRESITLRGVSAKWTDEAITVHRDHVGSLRIRELSKARSSIVAGAVGAAAVFLIINRGIGLGSERVIPDPSLPPGGTPPNNKVGSLSIPFRSDY